VKKGSLDHDSSDSVRVNVRSRSSILEITLTLSSYVPRDSDGRSSVGYTAREISNMTGLVPPGESEVVIVSVDGDVFMMSL